MIRVIRTAAEFEDCESSGRKLHPTPPALAILPAHWPLFPKRQSQRALFTFFFSSFQLCSHTEEANNSCSKQKRERRAFTRQILNIMDGTSLKEREREKEENFWCSSVVLKSKKCPKNRATAAALFETAVSGNASSLCLVVYPKPFSLFTAFSTCGGKKTKTKHQLLLDFSF